MKGTAQSSSDGYDVVARRRVVSQKFYLLCKHITSTQPNNSLLFFMFDKWHLMLVDLVRVHEIIKETV